METCSRDPASGVRNRSQPSVRDRRGVSMGEATKTIKNVSFATCQKNSEDAVMPFCVAGVALCDIRRV